MQFDSYLVIGFPTEFSKVGELSPTMVYVHKLDAMPEGSEKKPWRTFAGKLGDKLVSSASKLALNCSCMSCEPLAHAMIGPRPFKRMGVPMIVFWPRS
jgi:hypothetical protein